MSTNTNPDCLPTKWLIPAQAAAYLQLSKLTLADLRTKGRGPVYHKAGALVRYLQADLDAWMEAPPRGPLGIKGRLLPHKEIIEAQLVDTESKLRSIRSERDIFCEAVLKISEFTLSGGPKDIKIADKMRLIADDAITECKK